nr:uncharacterized protein LOC112721204 [Arachis hypogaea]
MLELRDLESRILRRQEEDETKFKELRVRVAGIVEAVGHLTSHLSSCAISTSIVGCGEATPELSKDMNMELHGEEEELNQEPQQEEKIEIIEQKEVVDGCLGYVEYIKESQVEETSSKECGGSIKEESNVTGVNNELKEIDKEVDSISNDFLPTSINSFNNPVEPSPSTLESKVEEGLQPPKPDASKELEEALQATNFPTYDDSESTYDPFEFEESFPNLLRLDNEVDFTRPPIYDESDGEEIEEIGEEEGEPKEAWHEGELEEPYQVVETSRKGWTGVEHTLSRSLAIPLPNSSSDPPFEWPPTSRRSRARAVVEAARPSSSTAAGPSSSTTAPAPPSAPEPTYLLVQHLLRFMERFERRVMRRLDRLDQAAASQGIELPPLPESSASDEQDHEEEHGAEPTQQEAPPVTQTTPEVQHDIPEPQPVPPPVPQPEPEHEPQPDHFGIAVHIYAFVDTLILVVAHF